MVIKKTTATTTTVNNRKWRLNENENDFLFTFMDLKRRTNQWRSQRVDVAAAAAAASGGETHKEEVFPDIKKTIVVYAYQTDRKTGGRTVSPFTNQKIKPNKSQWIFTEWLAGVRTDGEQVSFYQLTHKNTHRHRDTEAERHTHRVSWPNSGRVTCNRADHAMPWPRKRHSIKEDKNFLHHLP